ncbi:MULTISPECIES: restriction endonuclease [unclassified Paenibacillus]|uniref:restriction endonuclease n=1 Tax=unclassified Paenibacillus TaxID=185978 RepID=UPI002782447E|nr:MULTISPECIES: restriction endonuclease [unclassified Paenibacillus]MDQ0899183.1 restriction system protein [Paenibacillus sp. V4I7]MDQ0914827.1 restriction system protein [Paenibacillus sp. V4I5]
MSFQTVVVVLVISLIPMMYYYFREKLNQERENIIGMLKINHELRDTLKHGIYQRFKKDEDNPDKEDPFDFEYFVAEIMEHIHDSRTYVTKKSGDFGVDIEEYREDGLYLGQVKCYDKPLKYEPIAIIHSQMIKQGAKGGYVVTTSSFTEKARDYAEGLNIELIEGTQLVEMWLRRLESRAVFHNPTLVH